MKSARLSEREDALDPAVFLVAFGPLASLAPEHSKLYHSLSKVIGRLCPLYCQEKKQRFHLFVEPADKNTRFTLAVPIQGDKMAKPCKKMPATAQW